MVSGWIVLMIIGVSIAIGVVIGYGLCIGDERRSREERLWMRLLYQYQLNEEKEKSMKKGVLTVLVLVGLCLVSVPAFPAEFSETNTQEIGDEVFACCVAKGVIKGENPPKIIMKVRSTCTDAYTAIHEELKNYTPGTKPAPAPKKAEEKPKK